MKLQALPGPRGPDSGHLGPDLRVPGPARDPKSRSAIEPLRQAVVQHDGWRNGQAVMSWRTDWPMFIPKGDHTRGGIYTYIYIYICFLFSAGFRPIFASRPVPTGRAREMVQNVPQINPGDQFQTSRASLKHLHRHHCYLALITRARYTKTPPSCREACRRPDGGSR